MLVWLITVGCEHLTNIVEAFLDGGNIRTVKSRVKLILNIKTLLSTMK